jgi:2-dehydropantoate 2-reductase
MLSPVPSASRPQLDAKPPLGHHHVMSKTRILIAGIGGVGGVLAGRFIQAGHDPILVTNNPTITTAINRDGIRVREGERSDTVPAFAYTLLEEVPRDIRLSTVYLAMKANTVIDSAAQLYPMFADDGFAVTLQNGVVEELVGEAVGYERVVSGIVAWGGTMERAGHYAKTSPGATHIGELDGQRTQRLERVAEQLRTVGEVVLHDNIRGALWSKLAINCVITTIGAVTGETLGAMLARPEARRLFLATYTEVIDTAQALGIHLERIAANPLLLYCPQNAGSWQRFKKDIIARALGYKYRSVKSSMLQSLERNRPTEIDFLNGFVVEQAALVGVPTPMNEALVVMVKEIEEGQRKVDPRNLDALLAAVQIERFN